jgi:hypothetical protein
LICAAFGGEARPEVWVGPAGLAKEVAKRVGGGIEIELAGRGWFFLVVVGDSRVGRGGLSAFLGLGLVDRAGFEALAARPGSEDVPSDWLTPDWRWDPSFAGGRAVALGRVMSKVAHRFRMAGSSSGSEGVGTWVLA